MGYFGGLGAGRGWWTTYLFPTYDLLKRLVTLPGAKAFVRSGAIPAEFSNAADRHLLLNYEKLLESISDGKTLTHTDFWGLHLSLVDSAADIEWRLTKDQSRCVAECSTPSIDLQWNSIFVDEDRVSFALSSGGLDSCGFLVSYPKVFSDGRDRHESLHETQGTPTHLLFEEIQELIQSSTVPCTLLHGNRKIRTPLRLSRDMIPYLEALPWFESRAIKVKPSIARHRTPASRDRLD